MRKNVYVLSLGTAFLCTWFNKSIFFIYLNKRPCRILADCNAQEILWCQIVAVRGTLDSYHMISYDITSYPRINRVLNDTESSDVIGPVSNDWCPVYAWSWQAKSLGLITLLNTWKYQQHGRMAWFIPHSNDTDDENTCMSCRVKLIVGHCVSVTLSKITWCIYFAKS